MRSQSGLCGQHAAQYYKQQQQQQQQQQWQQQQQQPVALQVVFSYNFYNCSFNGCHSFNGCGNTTNNFYY
jgi:hypothetical protein